MEFEYAAEADDELTINVGDVITEVVRSCDGWYEGKLNGKKGLFPDNFVKVCLLCSLCRKFKKLKLKFIHFQFLMSFCQMISVFFSVYTIHYII